MEGWALETIYPGLRQQRAEAARVDAGGRRDNAAAIEVSGMFGGRAKNAALLPDWDGDVKAFRQRTRRAAARMLAEMLTDGSRSTYRTAWKKFYGFCHLYDLDLVAWLHELHAARGKRDSTLEAADMVLSFLGWAKGCRAYGNGDRMLNPGSLKVYGYGVCKLIEEVGGIHAVEDRRLKKLLRKLGNESQLLREQGHGNKKLPLVAQILDQVKQHVERTRNPSEKTLAYMDACELAYFFAFRISELLLTSRYNRFDGERQLCVGNIVLYRRRFPGEGTTAETGDMVVVSREELLQPGIGKWLSAVRISLGRHNKVKRIRIRMHFRTAKGRLCPVQTAFRIKMRAVKLGLADTDMAFQVRGRCGRRVYLRGGSGPSRSGPRRGKGGAGFRLWIHRALMKGADGRGCYLRTATGRERVDPFDYSAHSPRAGFATTLFAAGQDALTVKDLGDWRSWAVLGYRHDDAQRFRGKSDILASFLFIAPPASAAGS